MNIVVNKGPIAYNLWLEKLSNAFFICLKMHVGQIRNFQRLKKQFNLELNIEQMFTQDRYTITNGLKKKTKITHLQHDKLFFDGFFSLIDILNFVFNRRKLIYHEIPLSMFSIVSNFFVYKMTIDGCVKVCVPFFFGMNDCVLRCVFYMYNSIQGRILTKA